MIGPLILIAGAAAFFTGFLIGTFYKPHKPAKGKCAAPRAGNVIQNKEYHNFLTYDGTPASKGE